MYSLNILLLISSPEYSEFGFMFVCFSHQSVSNLKNKTVSFSSLYFNLLCQYLEPNRHFLYVCWMNTQKKKYINQLEDTVKEAKVVGLTAHVG